MAGHTDLSNSNYPDIQGSKDDIIIFSKESIQIFNKNFKKTKEIKTNQITADTEPIVSFLNSRSSLDMNTFFVAGLCYFNGDNEILRITKDYETTFGNFQKIPFNNSMSGDDCFHHNLKKSEDENEIISFDETDRIYIFFKLERSIPLLEIIDFPKKIGQKVKSLEMTDLISTEITCIIPYKKNNGVKMLMIFTRDESMTLAEYFIDPENNKTLIFEIIDDKVYHLNIGDIANGWINKNKQNCLLLHTFGTEYQVSCMELEKFNITNTIHLDGM